MKFNYTPPAGRAGLMLFFVLILAGMRPLGAQATYINCGGPAYNDPDLNDPDYIADAYFTPSSTNTVTDPISGTMEDPLYQTERYEMGFSYNIPICNGTYVVDLHFAEIFFVDPSTDCGGNCVGKRVFDFSIENNQASLSDFDIYADVGALTAVIKSYSGITVTDGVLNIDFNASVDNAKISAIAIRPDHSTVTNYPPDISPIDNLTVAALTTVNVPVTTCDADSDPRTITISIPGLATSSYDFTDNTDGTATLELDPVGSDVGLYTATVMVTDDDMASAITDFEIEVQAPPVITGAKDITLFEGETASFTMTVTDGNDPSLTISVSPALPGWLTEMETQNNSPPNVPANYSFQISAAPMTGDESSQTYTVTADDGMSATMATFKVLVHGAGKGNCASPIYQINAGGAQTGAFSEDSGDTPSPYRKAGGESIFPGTGTASVSTGHPSLPPVANATMLGKERFDVPGPSEMLWEFPVNPNSAIDVRLYFAELVNTIDQPGERIFDVAVDGSVPPALQNIDPYALAGSNIGFMLDHALTAADDGCNTIVRLEFLHKVENPNIKGIEICGPNQVPPPLVTPNFNFNVAGGGTVTGDVSTGGSNTSDPDGCPIVYQLDPDSGPNAGTLTLNTNGTFTYTNTGGSSDGFSFDACDRLGACVRGTVSFTIGGVLPVELLYFQARAAGEDALLSWATATELNNAGFYLEKSRDGRQFERIGFVPGAGNSQARLEYTFLDENFDNSAYYRLRQEDYDGAYEYSRVVFLSKDRSAKPGFVLYPNPVSDRLTLQAVGFPADDEPAQLALYGPDGRRHATGRSTLAGLEETVNGRLPGLAPGLYLLQVWVADDLYTLRFVKTDR